MKRTRKEQPLRTEKKQKKEKRPCPIAQAARQVEWPSFPEAFSSALWAFLMTGVLSAACTGLGAFVSSLF